MASRTAYSTWTPQKPTLFSGHYLRNRSTLDIGVLGYIGIVQHKEHCPEVLSIPPGILCIRHGITGDLMMETKRFATDVTVVLSISCRATSVSRQAQSIATRHTHSLSRRDLLCPKQYDVS